MLESLASPVGIILVMATILVVAILIIAFWVFAISRRVDGVIDGLERDRMAVAEMRRALGAGRPSGTRPQMPIEQRQQGHRGQAAGQPAPSMPRESLRTARQRKSEEMSRNIAVPQSRGDARRLQQIEESRQPRDFAEYDRRDARRHGAAGSGGQAAAYDRGPYRPSGEKRGKHAR